MLASLNCVLLISLQCLEVSLSTQKLFQQISSNSRAASENTRIEFQAGSTKGSNQGMGSESDSIGTKRIESIQLGDQLDAGLGT